MKHNFRKAAREALRRARVEVDSGIDERLRYAALELRMCIEAITYDRAQHYTEELPPDEYKTWQPNKLLGLLVEIEPHAATSGRLSMQLESAPGEPDHPRRELGEQRVYGIREIQRNYHKLGNFLHYPTLGQVQDGGVDLAKARAHCNGVISALEHVLAAPIHHVDFKTLLTFDCECRSKIRKRVQPNGEVQDAECFECKAQYVIKATEDGTYSAERKANVVDCPTEHCTAKVRIPVEKMKPGTCWTCRSCSSKYALFLGVFSKES